MKIIRRPGTSTDDSDLRWLLGQSVRRARTSAGLSQEALAKALREQCGLGILRDGVNQLENGNRECKPELLLGVARVLGVPPVELLAGPWDADDPLEDEVHVAGLRMSLGEYARWVRGEAERPAESRRPEPAVEDERTLPLETRVTRLERRVMRLEREQKSGGTP